MMYHKALLFSDTAVAAKILAATHPRQVKALGREVSGFSDAVWHAHREEIVRKGSLLKFTRPADTNDGRWLIRAAAADGEAEEGGEGVSLRELLLRTGDRELVEASPMDRIWGIGYGAARAGSVREKWGLNLLGRALMVVRDELRKAQEGGETAKEVGSEAGEGKREEKGKGQE